MSWKTQVRHRFSQAGSARSWSDRYHGDTVQPEDHFFRQRRDYTVRCILERCDPGSTILDLGCGSGPVTAALRGHGRRVVALDYSIDMLRLTGQRLERDGQATGGLVQGDSEYLPFGSASVDAIVCLGVISYVQDYRSVLREIRRVLKPGGHLVLSSRNQWNHRFLDPAQPVKEAVRWLRAPRDSSGMAIGRFLSPYEVERRLVEEGFAVEGFTGMGFGPPRFNRKRLLSAPASIRLSDRLDRLFGRLGSAAPYRLLADVNLWVCRSAGEGAGRSDTRVAPAVGAG